MEHSIISYAFSCQVVCILHLMLNYGNISCTLAGVYQHCTHLIL